MEVKVNDLVNVSRGGEIIRLKVIDIDGDVIEGVIDNGLRGFKDHGMTKGDVIRVEDIEVLTLF